MVVVLNKCHVWQKKKKINSNPVMNNWLSQIHTKYTKIKVQQSKHLIFTKTCREQVLHPDLSRATKSVQKWVCSRIAAEKRHVWSEERPGDDSRHILWSIYVSSMASGCGFLAQCTHLRTLTQISKTSTISVMRLHFHSSIWLCFISSKIAVLFHNRVLICAQQKNLLD